MRFECEKFIRWGLFALVICIAACLPAEDRSCAVQQTAQIQLTLEPSSAHQAKVEVLSDGEYVITATGSEPSVDVKLHGQIDAEQVCVLAFSYFADHADDHVHVLFGTSRQGAHALPAQGLSHSEAFSLYSTDLTQSPDWKGSIGFFQIMFDAAPGQVIRLKDIVLRPPTEKERAHSSQIAEQRAEDLRLRTDLTTYLAKRYAQQVTAVYVSKTTVTIEGQTDTDDGQFYLAEIPIFENITELRRFDYVTRISPRDHRFRIELTRFRTLPDGRCDRLLSKWAVVHKSASGYELESHARYADEVETQWNTPDVQPRCKKGLGGVSADRPLEDLDQLGVCSITININLGFVHSTAKPGDIPFSFNGHKYFADSGTIDGYDRVAEYAAQRHIVSSAIILIPQARNFSDQTIGTVMADPEADPAGVYAMPNVISSEGVQLYAAALNFLAERYSRPDGKFGRIDGWIMHNEVDAGWVWTNAGDKSELTFMDLYNRSMRTMYLIARQYNPHAKVFISLTHFWNWTEDSHFYLPRQMLADLLDYSHTEGDYEWGIAYHPYPESLFQPRTWEDRKVSFSLDTPLITFKNIEVLNAWAEQPTTLYRSIKRRSIYLSEQGFNSPDYSEKSLAEQAAALAYAWKKIEPLDAIEAMQYHNWIDSRSEGGLRIGLRKFPDEPGDPMGKKPIWKLYQKLETPAENEACAFALPMVGLKAWNDVTYSGQIQGLEASAPPARRLFSDTWAATDALGRKLPDYREVGPPKPGRYVAMFYFLTQESPGQPGPRNVTTMLEQDPDTSHWQPGNYYWAEPEAGYYLSADEWVIRRHAELLSDAGVDVIVFDNTNDVTYPDVYRTIAKVFTEMRAEGEQTPQIAFLASRKSIDQLWADLYSKGLYKDLWFQWKGRPLLMTGQQIGMQRADDLPQYIQDFFTIRQSWAWDSLPWFRDGRDQWPWVAHYPQVYGWHESPVRPEAIPVSVSEHPLSNIGTSFHDGQEPPTDKYDRTSDTGRGLFFQEQWDRAIALDPELVFVTGWNEWTAGSVRAGDQSQLDAEMASWDFFPGAKLGRAGHPIHPGDLYFIDEYNEEFNRDIEPMKGNHTDNYYFQLVANIRRYKGVHAPQETSLPQTIDLAGDFAQWKTVAPEYRDHIGDTTHRNSPGNYQAGPYVDVTGRNDIVAAKVARDDRNLYFYVKTREPLTSPSGNAWMLLYIGADQDTSTGWLGYDYVVNTRILDDHTTTLCPLSKNGALGVPTHLSYRLQNDELMIKVPRSLIHQDHGPVKFDFHWTDNIAPAVPLSDFFLHGESAPERRFNYRYESSE